MMIVLLLRGHVRLVIDGRIEWFERRVKAARFERLHLNWVRLAYRCVIRAEYA